MVKYFKYSFLVTIICLAAAYWWGAVHIIGGAGLKMLFVAALLAVLEVTLSFDNAVVNAIRLEKMNHVWQQRFLTWGILVAVFGMRLLFPVLIVAIFSHQSMINVFKMALEDVTQYTYYLHIAHIPLVTFGGIFLLMIFLSYFFKEDKKLLWIPGIEKFLSKLGHFKSLNVVVALFALLATQNAAASEQRLSVIIAGIAGILTFLLINGASEMLEGFADKQDVLATVARIGFINFLYLELIDASFSLDGLLGAFAISKDIIIITVGLAIGAMFVRSLTIFMVEKKTLKTYVYLEHGAHWAIGFLALIMLTSTRIEVPEWITGLCSLFIITTAFLSSMKFSSNGKWKMENGKLDGEK